MKGLKLLDMLACTTSVGAIAMCLPTQVFAQSADTTASAAQSDLVEEVVVTGLRASLERSIEVKRNAFGVVDAISAEDIGKFPDTNLAESLQRISGVGIDRSNGEGSQVTVRGFGPSYNLVMLNGRTLATALVQAVGTDGLGDDATGTSRSFDFANLASEGVRTLEVYKTGRAAVPSGGIGAAINIVTRKPLDAKADGFSGSIGAKAVYDASVDGCLDCGSKVTPEFSGVLNWKDPQDVFGVALFGSYQKRHFTSIAAGSNNWNIRPYGEFLTNGSIEPGGICPANVTTPQQNCTIVKNAPTDPTQLVAYPDDSAYHYAEGSRERLNGQAVVQYRPNDSLTVTADALFAQNRQSEVRSSHQFWFGRPYNEVRFDDNAEIPTAYYLHELQDGAKDMGFEEQNRAQKSRLEDYGLNVSWDIADNFTMTVDGHLSRATSRPDNPNGFTSTRVGVGAKVIAEHSVDYSGAIPVRQVTFGATPLNLSTVGSTIARTSASSQTQDLKELRTDFGWDLGEGSRFDFGGAFRSSDTRMSVQNGNQTLGNWGIDRPGDIQQVAPGLLEAFCMACKFDHFKPGADPETLVAFRGDAAKVYAAMSPYYQGLGNAISTTARADNRVKEDIWAVYGQITWKGEIAGRNAGLVAGARFEHTKSRSTSIQSIPVDLLWRGGDFNITIGPQDVALKETGSYTDLLPAMDFQIELRDNLIGRFSASRTIARANYGDLFSATQIISPGVTAVGQTATAGRGNPGLKPLTSDNFDLSLEYYYKPDSYVSIGVFDKRVHNFVGVGQTQSPLFGLRDSTSGAAGTTSGNALAALRANNVPLNQANLFVMSALIQNRGSVGAATSEFLANYDVATAQLNSTYANAINNAYDVNTMGSDPLWNFLITQPVNNREAEIYGVELAGQHFFGDTGFGVAGSYTIVQGDLSFDNAASPNEDQFALLGLSDSANVTLIYDKSGLSARLAYNWRDKFLSSYNRVPFRNPVYNAPFGQLDLNISYDITPSLAVAFEGINLTKESVRTYGRDVKQLWYAQELDRRFMLGARYKF
jgi:TonB-dependent receptor